MANSTYEIDFRGNDKVSAVLDRVTGKARELNKTLLDGSTALDDRFASSIAIGNLAAKGISLALSTLRRGFTEVATEAREFINMSERFNMAPQEFQKFKRIAMETGVTLGVLTRGFKGFERTITQALAQPAGAMANMYNNIGVGTDKLKAWQKDLTKGLTEMKDILDKMDEETANIYAQKFFGTTYSQMEPALKIPSEKMKFMMNDAGPYHDQSIVANSELANQALLLWNDFKELLAQFGPLLTVIVGLLRAIIDTISGVIKIGLLVIGQLGGLVGTLVTMMQLAYANHQVNVIRTSLQNKDGEYTKEDLANAEAKAEGYRKEISDKFTKALPAALAEIGSTFNHQTESIYHASEASLAAYGEGVGLATRGSYAKSMRERYRVAQGDVDIKASEIASEKFKRDNMEKPILRADGNLYVDPGHYKDRVAAYNKNIEKLEGELAVLEKTRDYHKLNYEMQTLPPANRSGDVHLQSQEQKYKEFIMQRKALRADRDMMENEMRDNEKLLQQQEDLLEVTEQYNALKAMSVRDEKMEKELLDEQTRLKRELSHLEHKISEELRKEQIAIELENFKEKEKNMATLQKIKIENMRKAGVSEMAIQQEIYKDSLDLLYSKYYEYMQAEIDVAQNPGVPGKALYAEQIRKEMEKQAMESFGLMQGLTKVGYAFTSSDAAKKGMGGGIVVDQARTLIDLSSDANKFLSDIVQNTAAFKEMGGSAWFRTWGMPYPTPLNNGGK